MAQFDARERAILRLRFVDGLSQSEIAGALGIGQMHLSRLLTSSLQTLRDGTGETGVQIPDEIGR